MKQRNTRQKQIIREMFEGKPVHLSVEDVLEKVRGSEETVGRATVYRNLHILCREGVIRKITGEEYSFFDGNPLPHDHLHCTVCNSFTDIPGDYDCEMDERTAELTGGEICFHSTVYEGICKDCSIKIKERKHGI